MKVVNIFVTGATGLVGRRLVLRLLAEGHGVTALVRERKRARGLLGPEPTLISTASPGWKGAVRHALHRCDAVVNLAGAPIMAKRWTKKRRAELRASRVELTHTLVDLMRDLPSPPSVLVSASAVGYYGDRGSEWLDEWSSPGRDFTARLCRDWEGASHRAHQHGVRVVNLRIGIVLSADGGALASMLPASRAGLGSRIGDGSQFFPWIHERDLQDILLRAIEEPTMTGIYNAVSPGCLPQGELSDHLSCVLGRTARLHVPAAALHLALGERASLLTGGQRVRPERLLESGFAFSFPSVAPALADLLSPHGHGPRVLKEELPSSAYLAKRGARYELYRETTIDAPLDQVFDFFSRAENLAVMTPPKLGFEILEQSSPDMQAGLRLDYRIGLGPLPMRWTTLIEAWEPGVRFVDVQLRGPYRSWWHEHRFEAVGASTKMIDRVLYEPPFGLLGRAAHRLRIASMLTSIFEYRGRAIEARFAKRTTWRARERAKEDKARTAGNGVLRLA